MAITTIDSVLVRPARGQESDDQQFPVTRIPHKGKFFKMLESMFENAERDCNIDIVFRSDSSGAQNNECRSLLFEYLKRPDNEKVRQIAARLASTTGNVSGLGLLFLICGNDRRGHRFLLARFPADQGVLAEEHGQRLEVEFVEKIFMKSSTAYKAATYTSAKLVTAFWRGRAVDKQINGPRELSQYWISDFLLSELATTGAAGTRRLGNALQRAVRDAPNDVVRAELMSAAQLIPNLGGKKVTARGLLQTIGASEAAVLAVEKAMGRSDLMTERFEINSEEFSRVATYKSVELDNGATLIAETARFDKVFDMKQVAERTTRYSTEGKVVSERLRKSR